MTTPADTPDRQPARPSTSLPGPAPELGRLQHRSHVWDRTPPGASVLQASGFRSDVTAFRLNARQLPQTGSETAFRWNTAEPVYITEAAHNPDVAGSNPAPATAKGAGNGAFRLARHGDRHNRACGRE